MTPEEARTLLTQYADGQLEPTPARELEIVLDETPALRDELKQIKEENALLEEALAPLRASKSARMRLTDAMVNVRQQAKHVAESLPERGWRIFRLCFCFGSLVAATLMVEFRPPSPEVLAANGMLILATVSVFALGNIFLLMGNSLAQAESRLTSVMEEQRRRPSALGVLMVQVFGAATVLAALGVYWWMV